MTTDDGRYDEMDHRFWTGAADRVDLDTVSAARVYDYLLGGSYNYAVDRAAGEAIIARNADAPLIAKANRAFLRRAVQYLAGQGIGQFLDIGSGLPTVGNVHEIAHAVDPDATVVYIDNDPVVIAHSREILQDNPGATAVPGDLRRVDELFDRLTDSRLRPQLHLDRPVAVLLVAVLHFFGDDDHPQQLLARLRDALPDGSAIAVSHLATESFTRDDVEAVQDIYRQRGGDQPVTRTREQVCAFFGDHELVDPGLVYVSQWPTDALRDEPTVLAEDPRRCGAHGGVAFKVRGRAT